MSLLSNIDY